MSKKRPFAIIACFCCLAACDLGYKGATIDDAKQIHNSNLEKPSYNKAFKKLEKYEENIKSSKGYEDEIESVRSLFNAVYGKVDESKKGLWMDAKLSDCRYSANSFNKDATYLVKDEKILIKTEETEETENHFYKYCRSMYLNDRGYIEKETYYISSSITKVDGSYSISRNVEWVFSYE